MRVAYIHGFAGVSGSLLLGALLDAGASLEAVHEGWRLLHLPAAQLSRQRVVLAEYTATSLTFSAPQLDAFLVPHTATGLIEHIEDCHVSPGVRQRLLRILEHLRSAASQVYGEQNAARTVPAAYLSEVLYMGSGVAVALDELGIEQCCAAPLRLGTGWVEGQQGRTPMPRPLTAELVRGMPVHGDTSPGEQTTVGGAAIVTALAAHFGPIPTMTIARTGYGAAVVDHMPRGLQVLLGDMEEHTVAERIAVLEANIDDMNPEFYEDIFARLFAHGALDVTLTPLFMKKNRPANTLTVLAPLTHATRLAQVMLRETSTFGVRAYEVWRQKLERFSRQVETCYGAIPVKCGVLDGRIIQAAPEYEACKRAAQEQDVPVRLVYTEAVRLAAAWLTPASNG
jgi:uncharacterized protein (TIGR00299 family) protein